MVEFYRIRISLNQIVAAGLFLGYKVTCWDPRVNYFLLGEYKQTSIFNINFTYSRTKQFIAIVLSLLSKKCRLWLIHERFRFFNMSAQFTSLVSNFPELLFFNDKWDKGSLTNFKFVKFLKPKKFPHGIFFPNMLNNYYAINECFALNIPSFSLVDSHDNPFNVFFPIPGGSRNVRSMLYSYMLVARTVISSRTINSSAFIFSAFADFRKRIKVYLKHLSNGLNKRIRFSLVSGFLDWRYSDWFSTTRLELFDFVDSGVRSVIDNFCIAKLWNHRIFKHLNVGVDARAFFLSSILVYTARLFSVFFWLFKRKQKLTRSNRRAGIICSVLVSSCSLDMGESSNDAVLH